MESQIMGETKPKGLFHRVLSLRDRMLGVAATMGIRATQSDAYARGNGRFLRMMLLAQLPLRHQIKMMNEMMQAMGFPMRNDVTSLAERLTNIEMRLDDLDAKLDRGMKPRATEAQPPSRRGTPKNGELS